MRLFILAIILCASSCDTLSTECTTELRAEVYNHARDRKAILFGVSGNATVADSWHVLVAKPGHTLDNNDKGNVFIADSDHGKA
ncbi:MAG: hypothetical protein V4649_07780 [Bacteroidota bacterium]